MRQHLATLSEDNKHKALNKKDAEGYTALHYAAKFNRFKILKHLIDSGAGERRRGKGGRGKKR